MKKIFEIEPANQKTFNHWFFFFDDSNIQMLLLRKLIVIQTYKA
jgi:hypothetical protein